MPIILIVLLLLVSFQCSLALSREAQQCLAKLDRAQALSSSGDPQKALKMVRSYAKCGAPQPSMYQTLGPILFDLGDSQSASLAFLAALAVSAYRVNASALVDVSGEPAAKAASEAAFNAGAASSLWGAGELADSLLTLGYILRGVHAALVPGCGHLRVAYSWGAPHASVVHLVPHHTDVPFGWPFPRVAARALPAGWQRGRTVQNGSPRTTGVLFESALSVSEFTDVYLSGDAGMQGILTGSTFYVRPSAALVPILGAPCALRRQPHAGTAVTRVAKGLLLTHHAPEVYYHGITQGLARLVTMLSALPHWASDDWKLIIPSNSLAVLTLLEAMDASGDCSALGPAFNASCGGGLAKHIIRYKEGETALHVSRLRLLEWSPATWRHAHPKAHFDALIPGTDGAAFSRYRSLLTPSFAGGEGSSPGSRRFAMAQCAGRAAASFFGETILSAGAEDTYSCSKEAGGVMDGLCTGGTDSAELSLDQFCASLLPDGAARELCGVKHHVRYPNRFTLVATRKWARSYARLPPAALPPVWPCRQPPASEGGKVRDHLLSTRILADELAAFRSDNASIGEPDKLSPHLLHSVNSELMRTSGTPQSYRPHSPIRRVLYLTRGADASRSVGNEKYVIRALTAFLSNINTAVNVHYSAVMLQMYRRVLTRRLRAESDLFGKSMRDKLVAKLFRAMLGTDPLSARKEQGEMPFVPPEGVFNMSDSVAESELLRAWCYSDDFDSTEEREALHSFGVCSCEAAPKRRPLKRCPTVDLRVFTDTASYLQFLALGTASEGVERCVDQVQLVIGAGLGELSFLDQVTLFDSVDLVIGPHGAGLTNIMFMEPRRASIIEFSLMEGQHRHYEHISTIFGLDYWHVPVTRSSICTMQIAFTPPFRNSDNLCEHSLVNVLNILHEDEDVVKQPSIRRKSPGPADRICGLQGLNHTEPTPWLNIMNVDIDGLLATLSAIILARTSSV